MEMVKDLDTSIGKIIDTVRELELADNTLVFFWSDNGGSQASTASNDPLRERKHFNYEGGIRVPAMISFPGKLPAGETRDQIITVMDWFPTVLELCGISPEPDAPELDGHSIMPIVENRNNASAHDVLHFSWSNEWAVREGDWELIATTNRSSGITTMSLRNLGEENPEVKEHAETHPEIVAWLTALHEARL